MKLQLMRKKSKARRSQRVIQMRIGITYLFGIVDASIDWDYSEVTLSFPWNKILCGFPFVMGVRHGAVSPP
jgi:hypothetical protein